MRCNLQIRSKASPELCWIIVAQTSLTVISNGIFNSQHSSCSHSTRLSSWCTQTENNARHTVHCIQCSTYCTLYTVFYILYIVYSVLHTVHSIQCSTYCALYTVFYILYIVISVLHTVHCIQCSTYCTLYTVFYKLYIVYSVLPQKLNSVAPCGAENSCHVSSDVDVDTHIQYMHTIGTTVFARTSTALTSLNYCW